MLSRSARQHRELEGSEFCKMATHHSMLTLSENICDPVLSRVTSDSEDDASCIDSYESEDEGLPESEEGLVMGTDDEADDDDDVKTNSGWADAMAKILKTSKPKGKKSIVLAKAKKLNDVIRKEKEDKLGFEVVGDVKEEKPDVKTIDVKPVITDQKPTIGQLRIKKQEWYSKGRQKPNILDKDREKTLSKIGTKGVVQLFNAVRQQQKVFDSTLEAAGAGPAKRDKVLKTINKRAFLDVVMGAAKSQPVDNPVKDEKSAQEEDGKPVTWQVLRDDFLMGGRYKDWDREDPKKTTVSEPAMMDVDSDSDGNS